MTLADQVARAWLRRLATDKNPVIYTAIFLDPMDKRTLLKRFEPLHPVLHAHHMTIWFFKDGEERFEGLQELPLGKTIPLKIVGYVADDKAQLVVVRPPANLLPASGRTPHITISTVEGVLPVYANTLIAKAWDAGEARKGFPAIRGKVGWFDGQRERFDLPK